MFTNGKISEFLKSNWRTLLFGVAISLGILCGVWTCSKHPTFDIDANRNRITIGFTKIKGK